MKLLHEYIRELLFEDPNPGDLLLSKIKLAQEAFGTGRLSGGNCGTFAMALGAICEDNGISHSYGIIFEDSDLIESEVDLTEAEPDIYHVFLEAGSTWYDGDGIASVDSLLGIAAEYGDDNPGFFQGIANTGLVGRIVRNETDWDIPTPEFYQVMTGGEEV
tara:strand:- start:120 stop:602 length:483 start_codon:yes stop_codon:yes gene_type:complete